MNHMIEQRLAALRALMKEKGVDAYLVPTDDFHASEYVGEYFQCRKYITGFTGSAGTAVITQNMAGLWTDGRRLDVYGLLPKKIIELSPFHTSLFITNLASINTSYIFHHCYEFGTTSVFVCMGKPVPDPNAPAGSRKKRMPLGVVMDERIATGIEYSRFFAAFERYLKKPELLETRLDGQAVPAMA